MQIKNYTDIRINKFLADAGICSRREADELIKRKRVKINGTIAVLGDKVNKNDRILVNDKPITAHPEKIYIALHKPFGAITTTDKNATNTVLDYINIKERIFPVGRLDVESSGIILLTNDGELSNILLKARSKTKKEYLVTVNKPIKTEDIQKLSKGVKIGKETTLPAKVEKISANQFKITIIQGLNRQIRRMCEAVGYEIKILKRIKFAEIDLNELPRGKWRYLTEKEVLVLKSRVKN